MNPFRVFPIDVWEMVLSHLVSWRDVKTMFQAFPALDKDICNFKRMILIGKVLEPTCKYLSQRDILNLRLVCKQWKLRVENFLVNQPYYRAYDASLNQNDVGFWNFTERGANNYVECCSYIIFCRMLPHQIKVADDLLEYPAGSNPLIFGELSFDIGNFTRNHQDAMKISTILARFGDNVQYLSLFIAGQFRLRELECMAEMLLSTANIKRLNLYCTGGYCKIKGKALKTIQLPKLQNLETLEFGLFKFQFKPFVTYILKRYARQIRRINAPAYALTRTITDFSQLTELTLIITDDNILETPEFQLYEQVQVLDIIDAPNLVYLKIEYKSMEASQFFISIDEEVMNWLIRFPRLMHLALCTDQRNANDNVLVFYESGEVNYPNDFCSESLKTLKIVDNERMSYNFLHAMPNLSKLEISTRINPEIVDGDELANASEYRSDFITNNLQFSNVWANNSKLKLITVIANYGVPEASAHVNCFFRE